MPFTGFSGAGGLDPNAFTTKFVASNYTASTGERVLSDGKTVTLPSPEQDAAILVDSVGADVTVEPGGSYLVEQNDQKVFIQQGDTVGFVSDGTDWFALSGSEFLYDIPDSGDLQARYDATELALNDGDTVATWADETGNGYDLTASGGPEYVADGINGNPVVQYDGTDDFHNVAWPAISQPFNYFIVAQVVTVGNNAEVLLTGDSTVASTFKQGDSNNFILAINAGANVESGVSADTNAHIYGSLFDGGVSTLREDGSQIASGDPGTNQLDGLTVANSTSGDNGLNVNVGEILVYPQDKSGIQSDVETYLSDKWGITI